MDHRSAPYAEAVREYAERSMTPLCTPGHHGYAAGAAEAFGEHLLRMDVQPLVEGIDRGPGSPFSESRRLAADAWGARQAWFLTNGASQGNQAACLALRSLGESIVAQRSVHSSVIDGLALAGLRADFVSPVVDHELGMAHGVTVADLDRALLQNPQAAAAYVVSPSYFGAVADIAALSACAHRHGVPLVVDEAWGPHLGFHPDLPRRALQDGADLVISSTHKLGGSLTQSALLLLGAGPWAERLEPAIDRAFGSLQSTSASALLLASLDLARRDLMVDGVRRIGTSLDAVAEIRKRLGRSGRFRDAGPAILASAGVVDADPLHVVIDTQASGISGHEARALLFTEHGIHLEISTHEVMVAIVGAGARPDPDRLLAALEALPHGTVRSRTHIDLPDAGPVGMDVRSAWFAATEVVGWRDAIGRVSADCVAAYPPGIPNVMPGEIITGEVVDFLRTVASAPFGHIRGGIDPQVGSLRVVTRA